MRIVSFNKAVQFVQEDDPLLISGLSDGHVAPETLIIPLVVESTHQRHGHAARQIPILVWLPGALVFMGLTFAHQPLAPLIGSVIFLLVTMIWLLNAR